MDLKDIVYKIIISLFVIFYYFYALVIAKQVKVMNKALEDKHNWLILLITSLQVTVSMILLIILIISIFLI